MEKQHIFARYLTRAQKNLNPSTSNGRLPRNILLEAFSHADIHLVRNDAQDIWEEMITNFKFKLSAEDILDWLKVNLPTSFGDVIEHVTLPAEQRSRTSGKKLTSLATFQQSPDELAQRAMIQSILKNKVHLAFVFRTYGCGSGIISGTDLCHALRQSPFDVTLSDAALWKFVCQIVSMDPSDPPSSVFLRYNEVLNYLESEYGKLSPPLSATLQSSIRHKLEQSRYIQGIPDRVLGHLQILRQRLRNIQQRGTVTSWEGIPDMCSIREFIALLQSIDMNITAEEANHIWAESRKNRTDENSWNFLGSSHDDGMKAISIGSGLTYLDSLLRSSG